jgi:hypothetical protein
MLSTSQAPQASDLLRPTVVSAAAICYACLLVGPDGAEQQRQHDEPVPRWYPESPCDECGIQ